MQIILQCKHTETAVFATEAMCSFDLAFRCRDSLDSCPRFEFSHERSITDQLLRVAHERRDHATVDDRLAITYLPSSICGHRSLARARERERLVIASSRVEHPMHHIKSGVQRRTPLPPTPSSERFSMSQRETRPRHPSQRMSFSFVQPVNWSPFVSTSIEYVLCVCVGMTTRRKVILFKRHILTHHRHLEPLSIRR